MFFQRPSILNKFPKIHGCAIKTVHARASWLHFPTPFWAWSWPWGWYQKIPIMFFQRASTLNNFPKNSWLCYQNCACQGLKTPFSNTFLSLRSAQMVVPNFWPDQVTHPCSAYVISKNHLSMPCSFRGVGGQNNTFACLLLYVGLHLLQEGPLTPFGPPVRPLPRLKSSILR